MPSAPHLNPLPPAPLPPPAGLYTELDFRNEALNAQRMRELLDASDSGAGGRVAIPAPVMELTTRCGAFRLKIKTKLGLWGEALLTSGWQRGGAALCCAAARRIIRRARTRKHAPPPRTQTPTGACSPWSGSPA